MIHVPFAVVFTLLALALSVVPAVVVWVLYSDLMDSPLQGLYSAGIGATDSLANEVLNAGMQVSLNLLDDNLFAGTREIASQQALLYASGLIDVDLQPNVTDLRTGVIDRFREYNFDTMKGHTELSFIQIAGIIPSGNASAFKTAFWIHWQALDLTPWNVFQRTLYLSILWLSPDGQNATWQTTYTDQTTGVPVAVLQEATEPWQDVMVQGSAMVSGWKDDLTFNRYSGQVELNVVSWVNRSNQWFRAMVGFNVQALSEGLQVSLANEPYNRIFMFFRNANGHLIAASHGKFYSHSDVDSRFIDPIRNPPNLSTYALYTCLNSTDAFILGACQQLVQRYGSWAAIPEGQLAVSLQGRSFWVGMQYSTSSLPAMVVMLVDRESLMGLIDASNQQVLRNLDQKRGIAAVVLALTTSAAAVLPVLVGLWLAWHMIRLTSAVKRIAKLDFSHPRIPTTTLQEVHDFQRSFLQMERGLRAFAQFVPQAVVTQLVAGQLR
eukprot:EG_transcript_10947